MRRLSGAVLAIGAAMIGAAMMAGPARADGYPPFYGYSGYFGGPTTYWTRDSDVQQATTREVDGFDVRTYYRGGPFWTYAPAAGKAGSRVERRVRHRRTTVLRRRG